MESWVTITNVQEVDSPSLVIYTERVRENIRILKKILPDVSRLRPHVKTSKSAEVSRLLLDGGIRKFKCATVAEAEMLALAGAPDVLLAHQPVGPKAQRVADLVARYDKTLFSTIVDDLQAARALSDLFEKSGGLNAFIDLDVGMHRTGIAPSLALELADELSHLKGLRIVGLHVYDGHIRDQDAGARARACNEAFRQIESLREAMEQKWKRQFTVVAGGTPTFPIHAKRANVECSPGTFVYWDEGYRRLLPDQPFLCAALVVTRVISKPDDETICTDLGHKAIAAENPLTNRVYFLNAPELVAVGHSEEHLVLKAQKGNDLKVGDVLYGVPHHICPTVALHDSAYIVENNRLAGTWETNARKRRIST